MTNLTMRYGSMFIKDNIVKKGRELTPPGFQPMGVSNLPGLETLSMNYLKKAFIDTHNHKVRFPLISSRPNTPYL